MGGRLRPCVVKLVNVLIVCVKKCSCANWAYRQHSEFIKRSSAYH